MVDLAKSADRPALHRTATGSTRLRHHLLVVRIAEQLAVNFLCAAVQLLLARAACEMCGMVLVSADDNHVALDVGVALHAHAVALLGIRRGSVWTRFAVRLVFLADEVAANKTASAIHTVEMLNVPLCVERTDAFACDQLAAFAASASA